MNDDDLFLGGTKEGWLTAGLFLGGTWLNNRRRAAAGLPPGPLIPGKVFLVALLGFVTFYGLIGVGAPTAAVWFAFGAGPPIALWCLWKTWKYLGEPYEVQHGIVCSYCNRLTESNPCACGAAVVTVTCHRCRFTDQADVSPEAVRTTRRGATVLQCPNCTTWLTTDNVRVS